MGISANDRAILRDLAKYKVELAHSPAMDKLRKEWEAHGRFDKNSRPMVMIELWTFGEEILPPLLKCEGEEARGLEQELWSNIVNHTLFKDDTIVRDYVSVSYGSSFKPFNIDVQVEHTGGLGHHFIPALGDLEDDFHKLKKSAFSVSKGGVSAYSQLRMDTYGDILPVKLRGGGLGFCPTQDIVHIMSMEDMFINMSLYPELYKQMMEMLTNDYLEYIDLMEKEGVILPTWGEAPLAQGTYCFNNKLPKEGEGLKASDVWCYMDSQESSGISPDMYKEFVSPYYDRISQRFGLLSYGCCEAVDPIWENSLKDLKNLGKVSISPWCNEEKMGEHLKGKEIVYLRKPSPNLLGVGDSPNLDEDAVRAHFAKTISAAKGCTLEIAQRDVYTVAHSPQKVARYVELIREACANHEK